MKRFFTIVVLAVVTAFPVAVQAVGLEIAVGGWSQSPSGEISYEEVTAGDRIDLERDLRYGDEFRFTGRAKLDMPLLFPNIYLMVTPMSFSGTGQKTVAFNFGGQAYAASTNFESEVTLTHYDVGLYYGLPFVETASAGLVNVDLGLNLRVADLKAEITQALLHESESLLLPIPMVYAAAQFTPVERFSAEAEIRGVAFSGNSYYSLIGRLKAKVFGPSFAAVGYRYDAIEVDESDLLIDAAFDGFFFEVGVEF